jgi:hypothetical protein
MGESHMAQARQGSKKRKASKAALRVWATAGASLAIAGNASANTPAVEVPSQGPGTGIVLAEQEVSDLAWGLFTFLTEKRILGPA